MPCNGDHMNIGTCRHRALAALIIDDFEGLLDSKNISIPTDEREGEPEEARIYGKAYYDLEDVITNRLVEAEKKHRRRRR